MSIPRYPKYKPSGVEWLGDVPEHWRQLPVWLLFELGRGRVISHEEIIDNAGEYPVYSSQTENDGIMGCLDSYAFDGDYLTWTTDGANAGTVFRRSGKFNCTNVCGTLKARSPDVLLDYCWHALAISTASFVRHDINPKLMNNVMSKIRIPIPSIPEQTQIASFLDRETAKIDGLVGEQRRLIELLKEKRQAVISHAVTKGLNPHAPLKPSGIEWLGDVPEHWESKKLRYLFRQQKRQDQDGKHVLSVYRDYGVIRKDSRDDNMNKTPDDLSVYQLVNRGDLVVNKMKAWQGSLGVSDLEGITSPDYVVFSPLHRECASFLHLLLRSDAMVSVYRFISNGIRPAQWRLEPEEFLSFLVFLPPINEQEAVVSHVIGQISRFDALTAEAERAIDLLQERRTALISAAVTGKIDVRGLAETEAA